MFALVFRAHMSKREKKRGTGYLNGTPKEMNVSFSPHKVSDQLIVSISKLPISFAYFSILSFLWRYFEIFWPISFFSVHISLWKDSKAYNRIQNDRYRLANGQQINWFVFTPKQLDKPTIQIISCVSVGMYVAGYLTCVEALANMYMCVNILIGNQFNW